MAYCKVIPMPGGGTAILRMGGRRPDPCQVCRSNAHTRLCDALNGRTTCDLKLCDTCATRSGKHDFCPTHKHLD